MVKVVMLRNYMSLEKGTEQYLADRLAKTLIEDGFARPVGDDTENKRVKARKIENKAVAG